MALVIFLRVGAAMGAKRRRFNFRTGGIGRGRTFIVLEVKGFRGGRVCVAAEQPRPNVASNC